MHFEQVHVLDWLAAVQHISGKKTCYAKTASPATIAVSKMFAFLINSVHLFFLAEDRLKISND